MVALDKQFDHHHGTKPRSSGRWRDESWQAGKTPGRRTADILSARSHRDTSNSSCANEIIYCGYRLDPESQLYYVRNRTYNPVLGRWIQRDPIGFKDGANLYGYVGGGPVGVLDPGGLIPNRPPGPFPGVLVVRYPWKRITPSPLTVEKYGNPTISLSYVVERFMARPIGEWVPIAQLYLFAWFKCSKNKSAAPRERISVDEHGVKKYPYFDNISITDPDPVVNYGVHSAQLTWRPMVKWHLFGGTASTLIGATTGGIGAGVGGLIGGTGGGVAGGIIGGAVGGTVGADIGLNTNAGLSFSGSIKYLVTAGPGGAIAQQSGQQYQLTPSDSWPPNRVI